MPGRSPLVELAHKALQNPSQYEVDKLLKAVNLSKEQREIIIRNELHHTTLENICNFERDGSIKPVICSRSRVTAIKKDGMLKIGRYLTQSKPALIM